MKIIAITDGPIGSLADVREMPRSELGEIIVRGPSTTREYFRRLDATEGQEPDLGKGPQFGRIRWREPTPPAAASPNATIVRICGAR